MIQDNDSDRVLEQNGWRFYASGNDVKHFRDGVLDHVPSRLCGHDAFPLDIEEIVMPSTLVVEDVVYKVTSIVSEQQDFVSDLPTLKRLKFPETVTRIGGKGERMFCNLPLLEEVKLPSGLERVGGLNTDVLCDCPNLSIVTIPASLRNIAYRFLGRCGAVDLLVADLDSFIDISYVYEGGGPARLPSEDYFAPTVVDWLSTLHPGVTVCNHDVKGWPELKFATLPRSHDDFQGLITNEYVKQMYALKHVETYNRVMSRWAKPDDTVSIILGADSDSNPVVDGLGRFVNCRELLFLPEVNNGSLNDWPVDSLKRIVVTAAIYFEHAVMDSEMRHAEGLTEILYRPEIAVDKLEMCENVMQILDAGIVEREITYRCGVHYGAFAGQKALRRVELPEGVELIDFYAFSGCSALSEVVLPSTIKNIMACAFAGCDSLKQLTIPNGDCIVDEGAFPDGTVVTLGA